MTVRNTYHGIYLDDNSEIERQGGEMEVATEAHSANSAID